MKKPTLIIITLAGLILSGISLGQFCQTQKVGDPEFYILLFSIITAAIGIIAWWIAVRRSS